ncbi:MAG: c-type cytochrome [Saprospiraceae bacterium]|nr:c-type cytochrome [Saprospiraceae bacterium]
MTKSRSFLFSILFFPIFFIIQLAFQNSQGSVASKPQRSRDTTIEDAIRLPENAVKNLTVTEGLRLQLFASEPIMSNPTNIDVDDKGRVWVCEAFNYRPAITGKATKKEGDRILILEDTDGDGVSDKSTVFYQGVEIEAPLGIWVMGNKAIVSQSPYVWLFTDENGDLKADKKEVLLQGIGGTQHDHGMHAFTFGPDGKFYFNFGNEGQTLKDGKGNTLKDKEGKEISLKNYRQGMVFRCNPDMTDIEVLGHNFRNNYEVCVDSYGTMWQSDNDDDGNKGVRINYVMDYGNYGYTDEMTGAGWQANRTNIEAEIPHRHWHLNDPGVVPNLLQTGAGSPCGMVVYEGDLLPEVFRGQMIHADAGPNVVRSYPVTKDGAGYKASIVPIVEGRRDQWFRPSDVCVAPDGSLMISDWYDPGVGGHQAGDLNRGRIFRVSPPNTPYKIPTYDFNSTEGALKALENPNLSIRWKAWNALHNAGEKAEADLLNLYNTTANPRLKARAFWLLAKGKNGAKYVALATKDKNPDIRCAAVRAARQGCAEVIQTVRNLFGESDAQVRRECLLALRHNKSPEMPELMLGLMVEYDGKDRWYLEAIGIGADGRWDEILNLFQKIDPSVNLSKEVRNGIIWRSRGEQTASLLAPLATDKNSPLKNRLRYFRAFDFIPSKNKSDVLLKIIKENGQNEPDLVPVALRHLDADFVKNNAEAKVILGKMMGELKGKEYLEFADRYKLPSENTRLLDMISKNEFSSQAAAILLKNTEGVALFQNIVKDKKREADAIRLLTAIRGIGSKTTLDMLQTIAFDKKRTLTIRKAAFESLGGSWGGEDLVLELLKNNKIDKNFIPSAVQGVSRAWRVAVRLEAAKYLGGESPTSKKIPAIPDILKLDGNAKAGIELFKNYCSTCHQVNGEGVDYGPKLSEIGSKLSREGQLLAILYPDAGISFGYEGWDIKLKDGTALRGIVASRTETDWLVKQPDGSLQSYKIKDIVSKKQITTSLMPSGFHEAMTEQQLADLTAYLMSLKRKG